MPRPVRRRAFARRLEAPGAVIERLDPLIGEFRESAPEEFHRFVAAELEKWGRVARTGNVGSGRKYDCDL